MPLFPQAELSLEESLTLPEASKNLIITATLIRMLVLIWPPGPFLLNILMAKPFSHLDSFTSKTLHLFTDASNVGFGCVFGTKWFFGSFDTSWLEYHISVREFFPILAVENWGSLLTNTYIVLHSDNIAVVYVINKLTSKDLNLMKLMKRLMVTSLKYNISFHAEHIPGLLNNAADLLSRLQVQQFKVQFPVMDKDCTKIPQASLHL